MFIPGRMLPAPNITQTTGCEHAGAFSSLKGDNMSVLCSLLVSGQKYLTQSTRSHLIGRLSIDLSIFRLHLSQSEVNQTN